MRKSGVRAPLPAPELQEIRMNDRYNKEGINELNQLIELGLVDADLEEAVDDFVNSVPSSALSLEDELKIQAATAQIADLVNSIDSGIPYLYPPSFAPIPYLVYDSTCFPERGFNEKPDGAISFTPAFSPTDSEGWSVWWESFMGFRLWWSVKGSVPKETDEGIYYFWGGKEISAKQAKEESTPPTLKYKIMERDRLVGKTVSWVSIYENWKEVLPLFEGHYSEIIMTWDKQTGNVEEYRLVVNESLWDAILSILKIQENKSVDGIVTFSIYKEPVNVNFFQTTGLKSHVEGKSTLIKERWVRPLNPTGIVAIAQDEESYKEFRNNNNPFTWHFVRTNVQDSASWGEAGAWLFSGCYLVSPGGWSGSWIDEALEDDRVRQISFSPGVYEYRPVTAWEVTRRKWEEMILAGKDFEDFLTWLSEDGDKVGVITRSEIEAAFDPMNNSNTDQENVVASAVLSDVPEMSVVGSAFGTLNNKADIAISRNIRISNDLKKEIDRASQVSVPPDKANNKEFLERVENILSASITAVTIVTAGLALIQSGELCRISNACDKFADDASATWAKFKKRFKGRRSTGGKNTFAGFKLGMKGALNNLRNSIKKKSKEIQNKIKALNKSLANMKVNFKAPNVSFERCNQAANKIQRQVAKLSTESRNLKEKLSALKTDVGKLK